MQISMLKWFIVAFSEMCAVVCCFQCWYLQVSAYTAWYTFLASAGCGMWMWMRQKKKNLFWEIALELGKGGGEKKKGNEKY